MIIVISGYQMITNIEISYIALLLGTSDTASQIRTGMGMYSARTTWSYVGSICLSSI